MTFFQARRWTAVLTAAVILVSSSAFAQIIEPPSGPKGTASIELDVEQLLLSPDVLATSAEDDVWTIKARPGKRLLQIPLIIRPGEEDAEVASSNIKVSSGGFLCFSLHELPEGIDEDSEAGEQIRAERKGQPVFAKKFVITPKDRVIYPMERVIFGGDVKGSGDSLYRMAINRALLNAKAPKPPDRRAARTADERARALEAMTKYRMESQVFRDLRKEVSSLPKEFDIIAPKRIWAIFDISVVKLELELQFPDTEDEWLIDIRQLEALRDEAQKGPVDGDPNRVISVVQAIGNLANEPHRYSQRLVAFTLGSTELGGEANIGDILFIIFNQMLEVNDQIAYRVVVKELASTIPPTRATLALLKLVAERKLAPVAVDAGDVLGPILRGMEDNPAQIQEALLIANRMLADNNGPPPAEVLTALINAVNEYPDALPAFAKGIRFANLTTEDKKVRLRDAQIAVIELSGTEPLASAWLDTHFLGTGDNDLTKQTLMLIANSDTGSRSLGPFVKWMMEESFGRAGTADTDEAIQRKAKLSAPIPIDSARHSIFRTLINNDPEVRKLAWQALPSFVMKSISAAPAQKTARSGTGRNTASQQVPAVDPIVRRDLEERYLNLRKLALNQASTPIEVVTFFTKQPDRDLATDALIEIVQRGTGAAPNTAANALLGSGGPIGEALLRQNYGERRGFAASMYSRVTGSVPDVIGVLQQRADENPRARWFGEEIAQGNLPKAGEWLPAFENEEELLRLAGSHDPFLARGALSVLIAAAGGDPGELLRPTFETFDALSDRSMSSLQNTWNQTRRAMFLERVKGMVGTYELKVNVHASRPNNDGLPAAAGPPQQSFSVANIELAINDEDVTIGLDDPKVTLLATGNQPQIQFSSASGIKSLQQEGDTPVPLGGVNQPVSVKPAKNGSWRGEVSLESGSIAVILLVPAKDTGGTDTPGEGAGEPEARGGGSPSNSATASRSE